MSFTKVIMYASTNVLTFMAKVLLVCLIMPAVLSACANKVGSVTLIPARPCKVSPGESIPLTVSGGEGAETFEWETSTGMVSPRTGLATTFTAPEDYSGQVIITVRGTNGKASATGSITCDIVSTPTLPPVPTDTQTPTITPYPSNTPTLTPTPEPIACLHPSITGHVFPQLKDEPGQFPFYGPLEESLEVFQCQGVYDISLSPPVSIRVEYHSNVGKFGYWGIGTPNGYDASQFHEICFWAYVEQPDQAFKLKFRDRDGVEKGVQIIVEPTMQWTQICTDLNRFSDQGVQLNRLENINLGFEQSTSSTTVWVDDFELR